MPSKFERRLKKELNGKATRKQNVRRNEGSPLTHAGYVVILVIDDGYFTNPHRTEEELAKRLMWFEQAIVSPPVIPRLGERLRYKDRWCRVIQVRHDYATKDNLLYQTIILIAEWIEDDNLSDLVENVVGEDSTTIH